MLLLQALARVIRERVGKECNARVPPQLLRLTQGTGCHTTSASQMAANYPDMQTILCTWLLDRNVIQHVLEALRSWTRHDQPSNGSRYQAGGPPLQWPPRQNAPNTPAQIVP